MARRLVSIRRRVESGQLPEYASLWGDVKSAAEAAGAHAWRFVSASDEAEFIEFIEFDPSADPRRDDRFVAALDLLESRFRGSSDEWEGG